MRRKLDAAAKREGEAFARALFAADAGADNVVAQALVELREKCAAFCERVPPDGALTPKALRAARALVAEIVESAEVAQMRLARKPAAISRRRS